MVNIKINGENKSFKTQDEAIKALMAANDAAADALQAAKAVQTTRQNGTLTVKVQRLGGVLADGTTPTKGNIGIYGLQRNPVTLYPAQWLKLYRAIPEIAGHIIAAQDGLSFQTADEKAEVLAAAAAIVSATGNAATE